MNMRKIIKFEKLHIKCDSRYCDYRKQIDINSIDGYLNVSCPKCGKNLLTQNDYENSLKLIKMVSWINLLFSWVTIFIPRKKEVNVSVNTHEKIQFNYEK